MKKTSNIYFLIVGVALTLIVFYNVGLWWMISSDSSKTFDEIQHEYQDQYPQYLQNLTLLTFIDIVMSSVAGLCFFKLSKFVSISANTLVKGIGILHFILVSWFIFSLM